MSVKVFAGDIACPVSDMRCQSKGKCNSLHAVDIRCDSKVTRCRMKAACGSPASIRELAGFHNAKKCKHLCASKGVWFELFKAARIRRLQGCAAQCGWRIALAYGGAEQAGNT